MSAVDLEFCVILGTIKIYTHFNQYIPDHDDSDPGVRLAVDSCKLQFPVHIMSCLLKLIINYYTNRFFTCWLLSTAVSSTATILRVFAPGTGIDL